MCNSRQRLMLVTSVLFLVHGCESDDSALSPTCCFSATDSPCATLSVEECEYHKFARCYIANDTWGVPRCTDSCGKPHCDPCCATQTCVNYDWSCGFCECASSTSTLSGCCGQNEHCAFFNAIPLVNKSLFQANGTCCPLNRGGPKCDQCARGMFGPDCDKECPTAFGRVCNGFGTCADGMTGDGTCTCEPGHLAPDCIEVQPSMYNCSSFQGEICGGHGVCTSMLPPKATGLQAANCTCDHGWLEPYCNECKIGFTGDNCEKCAFGFWAITNPGTGAIESCELCPGAVIGPGGLVPGSKLLGVCSTHGQCDDGLASNATAGQCFCDENFTGFSCEQCGTQLAPIWNSTLQVVQECIPCHSDTGAPCNGHGTCTNTTIQHIFDNITNTTALEGTCECDKYWVTDPNPYSPTYGHICSVELFHLWALVTALPAGIIILLVLLRKQLQKLFTICCRRNPECCCTPCCVRHQCCGLAAEKRKKQASEKKRKLSTNEKAESQQRLLDPVSDDAESRMHASVAAEKASAGLEISNTLDDALASLAAGLDFSDSDDEDMETGPSNMIGDTQIRQEYVILDEQQRQR